MTGKHVGLALEALAEAEKELAREYLKVGERHAVEHDVYHLTRTLAQECASHADRLTPFLERYGGVSGAGDAEASEGVLAGLRTRAAQVVGRQPAAGLLLLRDLRRLYVMAEECSIDWTIVGQAAQAARDRELLETVSECHGQTLMQVKWLTTRIKEAAPQTLVTG